MRPYHYRCRDHSLLTPSFKRWMVAPLLRWVPWALPANLITLISNSLVYAALWLALNPVASGSLNRLLIGVLLLLYLIGDHLDGMQAKRTGTGSALGEFCDHYLDAFNNGIILFTLLVLFDIRDPRMTAVVLSTSYLAHAAVFYEQFKTGWLTFERVGSLEGVLLIAAIALASAYEPVYALFTAILFSDFTLAEGTMLLTSAGALMTFFTTVRRTPGIAWSFWVFCILLVLSTALASLLFSAFHVFTLITLYSSLYVGRVMRGHLVDGKERRPDWAAALVLSLPYLINTVRGESLYRLLVLYLAVQILVFVVLTVLPMKNYWLWINPEPNEKS